MDYLFFNAVYFNGDVSTWDVSNVNSFTAMFGSCSNFNGNLSSWNTVRAVNMNSMFDGASKFQGHGLSNWNTSNVVLFDNMFKDSASFTGNISSWDMSNAQSTTHMVRTLYCRRQMFCCVSLTVLVIVMNSLKVPPRSTAIFHNGTYPTYMMQASCLQMPHLSTTVFVLGQLFFRQVCHWIEYLSSPVATIQLTLLSMARHFVALVSNERNKSSPICFCIIIKDLMMTW